MISYFIIKTSDTKRWTCRAALEERVRPYGIVVLFWPTTWKLVARPILRKCNSLPWPILPAQPSQIAIVPVLRKQKASAHQLQKRNRLILRLAVFYINSTNSKQLTSSPGCTLSMCVYIYRIYIMKWIVGLQKCNSACGGLRQSLWESKGITPGKNFKVYTNRWTMDNANRQRQAYRITSSKAALGRFFTYHQIASQMFANCSYTPNWFLV